MAFSMAWPEAGAETGADRDRALCLLTAFRGEIDMVPVFRQASEEIGGGLAVVFDDQDTHRSCRKNRAGRPQWMADLPARRLSRCC